jgi:hypothetical protein
VSDFPTHVPVAESTSGRVWEQQKPLLFRDLNQETRFPLVLGPLRARGGRTYFMMPLTTAEKRLGAIGVATRCCLPGHRRRPRRTARKKSGFVTG